MICDAGARGAVWNRTPSQPCGSSLRAKLLAATVSAKTKNFVVSPRLRVEALDQQTELVVEHRVEAVLADVAVARAVDGVAEGHVVGRHGLGDGAGGAADAEEPARHLLAGADLGERAVVARVQVDLQRLLMGVHSLLHSLKSAAASRP